MEECTFVGRDCVDEVDCHSLRWYSERAVARVASAGLAGSAGSVGSAGRSAALGKTGREIVVVVEAARKGYVRWRVASVGGRLERVVAAALVSSRAAEAETWRCLRRRKERRFCHS